MILVIFITRAHTVGTLWKNPVFVAEKLVEQFFELIQLYYRGLSSICNFTISCKTYDLKKAQACSGVPMNATRPSAIKSILSKRAKSSDEG